MRIFRFTSFSLGFVHALHTSNMAACYDNDASDVTAHHVLSSIRFYDNNERTVNDSKQVDEPETLTDELARAATAYDSK